MIFVWFIAVQVSGCRQVRRLVVVALCIIFVVALLIVAFCVVGTLITFHVLVVGIVDNKWSMGGVVGVCLPQL